MASTQCIQVFGMVKMTCWSWNWASVWGKKGDFERVKLLISTISTENCPKKRKDVLGSVKHDSEFTGLKDQRAPLACGRSGDWHHRCAADKSAAAAWCHRVNMDQKTPLRNVSSTFLNLCRKKTRQKWVQPGTNKVYQIKRPVSVFAQWINYV